MIRLFLKKQLPVRRFSPLSLLTCVLLCTLGMTSCDDDTAAIGTAVMPSGDGMTVNTTDYSVLSRTILVDSVLATTNDCRLGSVVDPETQSLTTCDFLAQFHVLDNYKFPKKESMIVEDGKVLADSCNIQVFISSYYGDSLNTMKIKVHELDTARVMEESDSYYTNLNPENYVNDDPSAIQRTLTFSVRDLTVPDSLQNSSSYYKQIKVRLPADYATFILNKYYTNPSYFKDSYEFIHHVCPGFFFKTVGGVGTMVNVDVSALNVYFRYHTKTDAGNDTIVDGMQRMGATAEVIQSTRVVNDGIEKLLDEGTDRYTYIKTPAGLFTEVQLPVDEIVAGEHYTDTINSARIEFVRHNNDTQAKYSLSIPSTLVMVRKADMFKFFEENRVPDSKTSYIANYSGTSNAYTFTNISRLISYCRGLRDAGAGVLPGDTEEERKAKYAVWEAKNEDWDKVVLVPVKAVYTTTTNSYGLSTRELLRVNNEMGLSSTRLVGGDGGNIKISIVYSKFAN